jgi:hypothetical protein
MLVKELLVADVQKRGVALVDYPTRINLCITLADEMLATMGFETATLQEVEQQEALEHKAKQLDLFMKMETGDPL